ncbi:hypothetical protein BH24BAC1_BH24BAC1_03540 [soil metagenome]
MQTQAQHQAYAIKGSLRQITEYLNYKTIAKSGRRPHGYDSVYPVPFS